ncbi:hypothetical protein Hdeb2414_s0055g00756031 [Helianthus debilis subsp. tardiflorus]
MGRCIKQEKRRLRIIYWGRQSEGYEYISTSDDSDKKRKKKKLVRGFKPRSRFEIRVWFAIYYF